MRVKPDPKPIEPFTEELPGDPVLARAMQHPAWERMPERARERLTERTRWELEPRPPAARSEANVTPAVAVEAVAGEDAVMVRLGSRRQRMPRKEARELRDALSAALEGENT